MRKVIARDRIEDRVELAMGVPLAKSAPLLGSIDPQVTLKQLYVEVVILGGEVLQTGRAILENERRQHNWQQSSLQILRQVFANKLFDSVAIRSVGNRSLGEAAGSSSTYDM